MAEWDFTLAPTTLKIKFELNESVSLLFSLMLLNEAENSSGLGSWIATTAQQLTDEQLAHNQLATYLLDQIPRPQPELTFPQLIDLFAALSQEDVINMALSAIRQMDGYTSDDEALRSKEDFYALVLEALRTKYAAKGKEEEAVVDDGFWGVIYDAATHGYDLQRLVVDHLRFMWDTHMKAEWQRVKPALQEAYDTYTQMPLGEMSAFEAIETFTGRDLRGMQRLEERVKEIDTLVFIPSAHLGPYVGWGVCRRENELAFLFTARPPRNATLPTPELSRSELLVRLNALSDETRLKMLELLTQHEELCAQDFITRLDLSQSSASRHLRQLTASGYLSERRRDVAKCYSLNRERIADTIQSLRSFLVQD